MRLEMHSFLRTFGRRLLRWIVELGTQNLMDTKWGRRVLAQLYREGEFNPH